MISHLCTRIRVQSEFYFDGQLTPAEEATFNQHLATCTACAAAVGEDLALMETLATLPRVVFDRGPKAPRWRSFAAAASIVLVIGFGSFVAGRSTGTVSVAPRQNQITSNPPVATLGDVRERGDDEILPLTPEVPGAELAFASPSDAEAVLVRAERDFVGAERSELRRRLGALNFRYDALDMEYTARALEPESKVSGLSVVTSLRNSFKAATSPDARSLGRRSFFASQLLRSVAPEAIAPLTAWVTEAKSPDEIRFIVRAVARSGSPEFMPFLLAHAAAGPAREVAVDGLAKISDPRSVETVRSISADLACTEGLRARASAALHRLGERDGFRLVGAALASKTLEAGERRRLFFDLAARPNRDVLDFLETSTTTESLTWNDRVALTEMLAHVAGRDAQRSARALLRNEGDRGDRAFRRAFPDLE